MKTALVTGVRGQDGAYLARLLVDRGYRVVGADRTTDSRSSWRLDEIGATGQIELVYIDLTDPWSVLHTIQGVRPDEVYNLAAQSFVGVSFHHPLVTAEAGGLGVMRMLEAVRLVVPEARFYQASSSEMFGNSPDSPQSENTVLRPRSPYGIAKAFGHWTTVNYREAHGLFASSGILFNHESPFRGEEFVTRKISMAVARIARGLQDRVVLGNLDAGRDWGYAPDYVEAMWRMLQQDAPSDYVVGTGVTHTVREFVDAAFTVAGIPLTWDGDEARDADGTVRVATSSEFLRPAEIDHLCADPSRARRELGWTPTVGFEGLVERMVEADLGRLD